MTEDPPLGGIVHYSVTLTAKLGMDHPQWIFSFDLLPDGMFKPSKGFVQTTPRFDPPGKRGEFIGMAVHTSKDPNKLMGYYLHGFSKYVRKIQEAQQAAR